MKYCATCNVQFDDSQNFCPNCGNALAEYEPAPAVVPPVVVAPAEEKPAKPPVIVTLLGFIGEALAILAAMFVGCAVAAPYIHVSLNSSYYSGYYVSSYFHPEEACSVFALLLALSALGLAVFGFIMTLIKKPSMEKLFQAILKVLAPFALVIVSIVLVSNL